MTGFKLGFSTTCHHHIFSLFFYFFFLSSPHPLVFLLESSLLHYQLAVASHLRLGSSSSLSTQAWLVVVIELVFRPAAPDSPSSTPVVISVVAELQIEKNICLLSVTIHPKLSLTAFWSSSHGEITKPLLYLSLLLAFSSSILSSLLELFFDSALDSITNLSH